LIDNIFVLSSRNGKYPALMGQMPSRSGISADYGNGKLSEIKKSALLYKTGAITSITGSVWPADDLTDPAAVHTFSHLSASIALSKKKSKRRFISLH